VTFSRRTGWNLAPNELARELAERRGHGVEVLDLTESNPTRAGLGLDEAALRALLAPAGSGRYEPDPRGIAAAREAVAGYYRERGFEIDPSRVVLSASSSEAYSWIFKLLCDPGDVVLVPRPGYPLFEYLAELENVRVETWTTRWDGGTWHVDFASLEAAIANAAGRARAIVLVHPANPTGAFVKSDEVARLESLAAAHDLAIISDEVFGDYGIDRHRALRAASFAATDGPALSFTLSGLSKVMALPQLKLGWTVVRGPSVRADEALARLEVVADTYLSVATPVQLALPALLARRADVQGAILLRVERNLAALRAALADSAISLLEPEGGWAAVLRLPRVRSDEEWARLLLREDGVLVQPGFFFDFEVAGHVVVSLLCEPGVFRAAIERLRARVEASSR